MKKAIRYTILKWVAQNNAAGQRTIPENERIDLSKESVLTALKERGLKINSVDAVKGRFMDRYLIYPMPGERIFRIKGAFGFLQKKLRGENMRMFCQDDAVILEVHNGNSAPLAPGDIESTVESIGTLQELPVLLGADHTGRPVAIDLEEHQGVMAIGEASKVSSLLRNMVWSLWTYSRSEILYAPVSPREDSLPKLRAEDCYHSITCCHNAEEVLRLLRSISDEMGGRAELIHSDGAADIWEQRRLGRSNPLPYLIAVIENLDTFISDKKHGQEIKREVLRIALYGGKLGTHCIASLSDTTQMDPLFKANFQSRIVLKLPTAKESRQVLDTEGAECLRESGDALLYQTGDVERITLFDLG